MSAAQDDQEIEQWRSLESNPEIFNSMTCDLLNVPEPHPTLEWSDIFSLDGMHICEKTRLVALVFLYHVDIEKGDEKASDKGGEKLMGDDVKEVPQELWYTRQIIGNACGTIGLLHALMNQPEPLVRSVNSETYQASLLYRLKCETKISNPMDRAHKIKMLKDVHQKYTTQGQTQVESQEEADNVQLHFICFVSVDGKVWELDGRKQGPVCHGAVDPEASDGLMKRAAEVIQHNFVARHASLQFSLLGLFTD